MAFLFINVNHDVGVAASESIPISLGYIIAALGAKGTQGVILDDVLDRPLTLKNLEKWIQALEPMVIGFTTYQSTINRIRYLSRYIKSRHRQIHVILGGPQAAVMPSRALEELEDVDALVRGEGEGVMMEMARVLAAGEGLKEVSGITCKCENRLLETGSGPQSPENLDEYPSPYLTNSLNLEGKDTAILLSSRGCRHVCRFCITPRICGGKVRYHSVERVVEEMETLSAQGIVRFWFADANFTDNRERTERLLDEKMRRGITTPFWCQTRSDLVDTSLLKKLQAAGADTIAFGLESGSPGVLKRTNKGIVLEQLREHIEIAQSLGMATELFSIFGLPGETVTDARQTMDFVRSLGIPIESNSGSQQMQLYFGSIYEKNPERFGFRSLWEHRPAYMSIGDRYETNHMTRAQIRQVRNMWALANEQIKIDVYYKQRIFEIMDFLLENRQDLKDEAAFYAYGALASSAIEEFELLADFLRGYAEVRKDGDAGVEELISALSFFRETDEPADPMDRVIFDSRSYANGIPFTGISGKYWDVLLGRGLLLPSFEQGFIGIAPGEDTVFRFVFPDDYVQEELRGKEVEVHAKIHKVFRSVEAKSLEDVKKVGLRNHYGFAELDVLRDQNEILYYLALRDADPVRLVRTPSHFLALTRMLAKLGKHDRVRRLASLVQGKPPALAAVAETLVGSGKSSWALEYYEAAGDKTSSTALKKVRCLLSMRKFEQAMQLLETIPESPSMEFQETFLACLKAAHPDSKRIPSLEHHVMNLRINAALERETVTRAGQGSLPPVVHGAPKENPRYQ